MKKIISWIKSRLPSKRKLIQVYAALLFNANLKGFATGQIYTGNVKNICTPGLNCYSCPGAVGACPLGSLQNSLSASGKTVPYYVFGILLLYGLLLGRWICGFLCPFGLIQELFHKIPTPKVRKSKITRAFSFFKYAILAFFVFIVPLAYATRNFPLPAFCKYICPAGTLEGALGLLSNSANTGFLRMLGPLFTWKFMLMVSFLVASVFIFRFFCRFICPLGAIYGFFNKISLVGVKVDKKGCTDCGLCISKCKMDVKRVGDAECIACGECINACPTRAISFKGSKFVISQNVAADVSACEGEAKKSARDAQNKKLARRNKTLKITVAVLMVASLIGALVYFNFIDGRDMPEDTEDTTEQVIESETGTDSDTENESAEVQKPPVGTTVGKSLPDFELDLLFDKGTFTPAQNTGKVTVLNFWYTTCTPCLAELPHFYSVAERYADQITLVAVHIEMRNVDVEDFITNGSGHPEWADGTMLIGYDTGKVFQDKFKFSAFPTTVVVNENGVITDVFVGGMTEQELIDAVEKALESK